MPENKDKIDLDDWDLSRAAAENRVDIVRLLIEQGADVAVQDEFGATPLHIAARNSALEMARLLIDRGADIEVKDEDGRTPLIYAVHT